MPVTKFRSTDEQVAHPQARLINSYLMRNFFNNALFNCEIVALQSNGLPLLTTISQSMPTKTKERLFICLLLNASAFNVKQVLNVNNTLFSFNHNIIAKLAALSGRFDLIDEVKDKLSVDELSNTLTRQDVLESAAKGSFESLLSLLNFNITSRKKTRDLLINADLINTYRGACLEGQLHIIRYLETMPAFNQLNAAKADRYQAYRAACEMGHLDVIEHLEAINGFDKFKAVKTKRSHAYLLACAHGRLNVIKHLETFIDLDKLRAANDSDSDSDPHVDDIDYKWASGNGHLEVIKYLETIKGFDKKKSVMSGGFGSDYHPYQSACKNGHINIIEHIEATDDFNKLEAARAKGSYHLPYGAYIGACEKGHLNIIKHLEAIEGFDKNEAARSSNYIAYQAACACGHIDVIKHLEAIDGFNKQEAAQANRYNGYKYACANGHLDVMAHLEAIDGFNKQGATETIHCLALTKSPANAYVLASQNGQLDVIKHLETIDGFDKIRAAESGHYEAYRLACANGHLDVIEHLEAIDGFIPEKAVESTASADCSEPRMMGRVRRSCNVSRNAPTVLYRFNKLEAATADAYEAYRLACANGHLDIIEHLEAIDGFDKMEAIKTDQYVSYRPVSAYISACENGHLDVVRHLEAIKGFDKIEAAKANVYDALRVACWRGHSEVAKHLLKEIEYFVYAESHHIELGTEFIYDWVDLKVRELKYEKNEFEASNPNSVFKINTKDSKYYFYVLRNLIRRGADKDYAHADNVGNEISLLLKIPSIKALCHQQVSANESENELLKLAMSIGNADAVKRLLGETNDALKDVNQVRLTARCNANYIDDLAKAIERVPTEAKFFIKSALSSPGDFKRLFKDDATLKIIQASLMALDAIHPELGLIEYDKEEKGKILCNETDMDISLMITCGSKDELFKAIARNKTKQGIQVKLDAISRNTYQRTGHEDSFETLNTINMNAVGGIIKNINTFFHSNPKHEKDGSQPVVGLFLG